LKLHQSFTKIQLFRHTGRVIGTPTVLKKHRGISMMNVRLPARSVLFGRCSLSCGVALAALTAAPAMAQEANAEAAEDEIIVTGSRPIAESEAAALAVQKNSDSLVAVVASDAVGRLPDQNIAV
jgi:hypothetical protein